MNREERAQMSDETYSISFEDIVEAMPGRILPKRYRIDSLLSLNPYTAIFRTFYEPLEQVVNIRLFKVRSSEDDYQYKRFQQEAKRLISLKHPNMARIIDYGILDEGIPFIVTENIVGPTLEDVLNRTNRIEPDQMVVLFTQIARAVQYGHEHGVLHETLKPSRIILFDDPETGEVVVKVTGFGLMALHYKLGLSLKTPAERQDFIGTPSYMSPEQCSVDKPTDGRSDVYSLGCMMYECLGGQPPFLNDDPRAVLKMHVSQPALPLNSLRSDLVIPKRLVAIVDKCLDKDHTKRYQFVRDLQTDLERDIDPSEREKQVVIPEAITKAQKRVKESFEIPIKQLAILFGGIIGLSIFAFIGINGYNAASQYADMGLWKSKLESGRKALSEGRIEDAGNDLQQSVVEAKKFKDPDVRMAMSLNEESNYFLMLGKFPEAQTSLTEATKIEKGVQTPDGQVAAQTLTLLSRAQQGAGSLADAEKSALQAVASAEKFTGENKNQLFETYLQLLRVYLAEKKTPEATATLAKMKTCISDQSTVEMTTEIKQSEALIDAASGNLAQAEEKLQSVLGERQEKIGLTSLQVIDTMLELGRVLAAEKKYDKAVTILGSTYDSKKKYFAETTPVMVKLAFDIGQVYEQAGKNDEAEKQYRLALESSEKVWGARHKQRLPYIDSFAKFLRKTGRISAAEVYEVEALEIRDPRRIPKIAR